ncbi:hypothetical protein ACIBEJ_33640 [Nonomuraea sp. NPDC050790]
MSGLARTVCGEAGIGKSRLVAAVTQDLPGEPLRSACDNRHFELTPTPV